MHSRNKTYSIFSYRIPSNGSPHHHTHTRARAFAAWCNSIYPKWMFHTRMHLAIHWSARNAYAERKRRTKQNNQQLLVANYVNGSQRRFLLSTFSLITATSDQQNLPFIFSFIIYCKINFWATMQIEASAICLDNESSRKMGCRLNAHTLHNI